MRAIAARTKRSVRRKIPDSAKADLITAVPGASIAGTHTTVRWPDRLDNPIHVWVEDTSAVDGWKRSYRTIVEMAFRTWEAVGVPVRFIFLKQSVGADVTVRWIDRFPSQYDGWTIMWWDRHGWITNGDMVLALRAPNGRPLGLVELQAIAAHEAGHVLGLAHASDSTALMAPTVRTARVTSTDAEAARQLYELPPALSTDVGVGQ